MKLMGKIVSAFFAAGLVSILIPLFVEGVPDVMVKGAGFLAFVLVLVLD